MGISFEQTPCGLQRVVISASEKAPYFVEGDFAPGVRHFAITFNLTYEVDRIRGEQDFEGSLPLMHVATGAEDIDMYGEETEEVQEALAELITPATLANAVEAATPYLYFHEDEYAKVPFEWNIL